MAVSIVRQLDALIAHLRRGRKHAGQVFFGLVAHGPKFQRDGDFLCRGHSQFRKGGSGNAQDAAAGSQLQQVSSRDVHGLPFREVCLWNIAAADVRHTHHTVAVK